MSFFGLGTGELVLILIVLLMFFGKDKLPELARSIGKSFKELKSGFENSEDENKTPPAVKTPPETRTDKPR